jgi:serine/threonine protein kinase
MSNPHTPAGGNANIPEPIPGYRLQERIGRGGYGEVWKTLAPGGVPKAIKLIYGDDSSRLATELRSLNRVKDVRHPFLLSIERIEQQGDLLAIVTELGDKNLQQHFQDCQAKGLPGIPQDDLLDMLRDVADALDYIYEEYALQHLDIKPANLLLFGRRLKVADFGLVKNIYERSTSLVHGLTPTYAAPEIFEGQPTRASDQYSLAILYQEMLSGILPFNGLSPARLATQHLRETPDLRPLPAAQQPIIARALSKDPLRRYSSSMELIKELIAARQSPASPAGIGRERPSTYDLPVRAQSSHSADTSPAVAQTNSTSGLVPPASISTTPRTTAPTIVIGIGGTAGKALQRLRLRIADRLGTTDSRPAFKLLFLDVDHDALNEANENHQSWSELETVPTPLHSSADYREQGHLHRRWLSRRWLFNIPRNLRTDGLRPLGRLALLSNAKRVMTSLRSAVQNMSATCPGTAPRVLVVASISGGTGSGMVLDLAYAARQELRTAGFADATVDGVLLHSTPVGAGRDKALLNAIATLGELDHYSAPGSFYPGEPLMQIPPFHGNNQTFSNTQFLHLGEDLDHSTWLRAVDNVAELLYCRVVTNVDQVVGSPQSHTPHELPSMDLVKVQQIGGYAGSFVDDLTRQLCVDTIDGWCNSELQSELGDRRRTNSTATLMMTSVQDSQNPRYQQLTAAAEARLLTSGVDVDQLRVRSREMLEQEMKVSQRDFLQAQFAEVLKSINDDVPDHEVARLVISLQDRDIGLDFGERPTDKSRTTLFDLLHSRLASQAMPIAARFLSWVCDVIDQPTGGIDAARHAAEAGRDCLREIITVLGNEIRELQTRQTASRIQLLSPPGADSACKSGRGWLARRANPRAALSEQLIVHGQSSFEELLEVVVHSQLRAIEANVLAVIDHLLNMGHELKQLGKRIGDDTVAANSDRGIPSTYECLLQKWLMEHRPLLVRALRGRIEQEVLTGPKKLQRYLQHRCSFEEALGGPLRRYARQVVLHSIDCALCSALECKSKGPDNQNREIYAAISQILREPWPLDGGGAERAALVVPAESGRSAFHSRTSPDLPRVAILLAKTNNVAICRVRCHAAIQNVVKSITHGQDSLMAVAANLHSRIDVEWRVPVTAADPLSEAESPAGAWSEVPQTVPLG